MKETDLREKRAMAYFRSGYNCCQSVALAFADVIGEKTGLTEEQIAAVTSGFGGGFARLREVCGSVSGLTFVAGAMIPAPADPTAHQTTAPISSAMPASAADAVTVVSASAMPASAADAVTVVSASVMSAVGASSPVVGAKEARRANYALVQKMAGRFREENGSIICRELLSLRTSGKESPLPSDRTPEYYAARPCERLVGSAAKILAESIFFD